MRILMFSHGYPPTISGVTLVVQKIARAMARRGHQITIVTASEHHKPYQDEDQGVQLQRVWGIPNPFWKEGPIPIIGLQAIHQLVAKFQPDVIHAHENALLSTLLLQEKWDGHPVLISSCYSLPRYITQYLPGGWIGTRIEELAWKGAVSNLNHFKHVVFCTRTHERAFLAHGLNSPTTVISNGVNIQRYCPEKNPGEDIERRYALPPNPRILSVGRLMKDKKLDLLIRAMHRVCKEQEAHLLIVGRGDEEHRLKALIHQLNLDPYIHLLGFVPEQDMPALYRACKLFVIPSIVEVQSLPTLQATVTGLPVVAANSASLPELVRHGKNGLLVAPVDIEELSFAILYILQHPEEAKRMGEASLGIGRAHDEQYTFQAYENFYQRIANLN